MPTCSIPIGSASRQLPSLVIEADVDPAASDTSACPSVNASRSNSQDIKFVSNGVQTKSHNCATTQAAEVIVAATAPKNGCLSWTSQTGDCCALDRRKLNEERMAASTAETTARPCQYTQRNSSSKGGKGEPLCRTANKEWLYSLRAKLDNLLAGATHLKKTQPSPPFGFKVRSFAKAVSKNDGNVHADVQPARSLFLTTDSLRVQQQAQPQHPLSQKSLLQERVTMKHWYENSERRSAIIASDLFYPTCSQANCGQGVSKTPICDEEHASVEGFLRESHPDKLLPIPLLDVAAARFGLDIQARIQQPFLGMEENDIAFQNVLRNYYTLKLSPVLQEVSLKLVMLSPHLAVFLGPENKPLLRLSALTNAKVFLIGASIEDSQRNTRYFSDTGNPIYCPSRDSHTDKLRMAELRGTVDAVLTAYAHLAYRLQHPWRKAVAFCVYQALSAGQKACRDRRTSCLSRAVVHSSATGASGAAVAGSANVNDVTTEANGDAAQANVQADNSSSLDAFAPADGNISTPWPVKNLDLVKRLLEMPPVMCEAPQIVQGVAVENAPVKPLCIPQIARDDVWVLPLL